MKQAQLSSTPSMVDPVVREVRSRFIADFSDRCDKLAALIARSSDVDTRADSARRLMALAHSLAGLAGLIGFQRVGALASELEDAASQLQSGESDRRTAQQLVASMREALTLDLPIPPERVSDLVLTPGDRGVALVVEDDEDQRSVVMRHLSEAGYRTEGVSSGGEVLDAARAVAPSVILLDVELPGLNGYTVCTALKSTPDLAAIPVVFITARAGVDDRVMGLALGAADYLGKPVDLRELVLRLERVRLWEASRAEVAAAAGILSYVAFLDVARNRLSRASASLVLLRSPAIRMPRVIASLRDEIRRSDLLAACDRNHLLVLLARVSGSAARTRSIHLMSRLADSGLDDVYAGVACAPHAGAIGIESLLADAEEALVQARGVASRVAMFGDPPASSAMSRAGAILIAEDDPDVLRILEAQLRSSGYETRVAFDGAEAMAAMERGLPDALILDLMMPRMGGFDVLARLRQTGLPPPKIVVLSARGREEDVLRAFQLGADDYVTKPFNPQELSARVARLLR